jgi:signal transduction histidine kinase
VIVCLIRVSPEEDPMNGKLMDRTVEEAIPESAHLRRCLRDLVALSTLPALWAGRDPPHIAESLADVLLSMLRADLVYIGLKGLPDEIAIEAARATGQPSMGNRAPEIGSALAGWLKFDGASPPPALPNPVGGGTLRIAVSPIRYEEEWGAAVAGSAHLDFPTELDRLLLSVAANQAAVALQNARTEAALRASEARYHDLSDELEQRVRERTAEVTRTVEALDAEVAEREQAERTSRAQTRALTRVLERLTQEQRFEEFPGIVLAAIVEQFGAASGALWIFDEAAGFFERLLDCEGGRVFLAGDPDHPFPQKRLDTRKIPDWEGVKAAYLRGECLVLTDRETVHALEPNIRAAAAERGIRTVLLVPMLLQGRLFGTYSVRSTRRENYGPHDFSLAQALAHQATLAIQMSRLSEQARQTAVLQERTRMAGEIHDGLGQAFTGILLQLGALELLLAGRSAQERTLLESARDLAREGLVEARRSAHALRPQALEETDLAGALERMTRQLNAAQTTRITFRLHGAPRPLRPDVADHLLRIGQEALTNALRHAQAREVAVALTFAEAELWLCVTDDGRGFAMETPLPREDFGLTGMQERAGLIGAQLTVASQPGCGTQVEVTWRFPPG